MKDDLIKKEIKKVLSFDRSADFLLRTADRLVDEGRYIDALPYLRRAIEKDPDHLDCKIAIAELYTEMGRFEESNALLTLALKGVDDPPPECYFGMGYNYMVQNEMERARENYEKYLDADPDGEFAPDAEELLDMMELAQSDIVRLITSVTKDAEDAAQEGKDLLDSGKPGEAVQRLEHALELDGSMSYAKNNLALACFCEGDTRRAMELTQEVLAEDGGNVHAHCNMAVFLHSMGKKKEYRERLEQARELAEESDQPDDLAKLTFTYCELEMDAEAEDALIELLDYMPYDIKALFCAGVACANNDHPEDAADFFSDVHKLAPDDGIAPFFKAQVESEKYRHMSYVYQVPMSELRARIEYLNDRLALSQEELRRLWREDEYFSMILTWGLNLNDVYVKQVVADVIGMMDDRRAADILSRFVLRKNEDDALKNHVLVLLKRMGVPEPFPACIDGKLIEVRVGIAELPGKDGSDGV